MIEITPRQMPKSLGGLAAGFMAAHLLSAPPSDAGDLMDRGSNIQSYLASHALPTFGIYSDFMLGKPTGFQEEAPLVRFFSDLLSTQERLGPEFEQVLFDNLWDLYAR